MEIFLDNNDRPTHPGVPPIDFPAALNDEQFAAVTAEQMILWGAHD